MSNRIVVPVLFLSLSLVSAAMYSSGCSSSSSTGGTGGSGTGGGIGTGGAGTGGAGTGGAGTGGTGTGGAATGGQGGGSAGAGGSTPLALAQALVNARCTGCHNPNHVTGAGGQGGGVVGASGELDLTDLTTLIGTPVLTAPECSSTNMDAAIPHATIRDDKKLVMADDPAHSYIVDKISPGAGGPIGAGGAGGGGAGGAGGRGVGGAGGRGGAGGAGGGGVSPPVVGVPQVPGTCFAGARMPRGCVVGAAINPCLTAAEVQIITDWINSLP